MAGRGCPMCDTLGRGDNDFGTLLVVGDYAEVHLQRWTRVTGYCAVIWRHGHVAEPTDLSPTDASGYWGEVLAVGRAIATLLNPSSTTSLWATQSRICIHAWCPATGTTQRRRRRLPGTKSSQTWPPTRSACGPVPSSCAGYSPAINRAASDPQRDRLRAPARRPGGLRDELDHRTSVRSRTPWVFPRRFGVRCHLLTSGRALPSFTVITVYKRMLVQIERRSR